MFLVFFVFGMVVLFVVFVDGDDFVVVCVIISV